ncbi:MAG: MATE family efflux transporter, partial [Clostridia bacterium]|nr:MATE family efflux transporter [Clostridia bacterium]
VVVGRFEGKVALAAVGSTSAITMLILNLFLGLSLGANVICARHFGAQDRDRLHRAMDTAVITAAVAGVALILVGFFASRSLLTLMGCPENVIGQATLYMKVYFCGSPFSMLYNFGAGILRAHGDTKRPMYILTVSGLVNVGMNLLFVIVFRMGVAGVAAATVLSQAVSCSAVLIFLFHPDGGVGMRLKKMQFDWKEFRAICGIGIPAGLNGITFALSNSILQSSVNSFGDVVMAGNTAANNLDNFIYLSLSAFTTANASFVGQNYGAKKYRRIDRGVLVGSLCAVSLSLFVAGMINLFPGFFIGAFAKDPEIIAVAAEKLMIVGFLYPLFVPTEQCTAALRGMGDSLRPFLVNVICVCGIRILWVFTVFQAFRTPFFLYLCYPVSWFASSTAMLILFFRARKKYYEFPLPPEESADQAVKTA